MIGTIARRQTHTAIMFLQAKEVDAVLAKEETGYRQGTIDVVGPDKI